MSLAKTNGIILVIICSYAGIAFSGTIVGIASRHLSCLQILRISDMVQAILLAMVAFANIHTLWVICIFAFLLNGISGSQHGNKYRFINDALPSQGEK